MIGMAQVSPNSHDILIVGALGLSGIGLGASSPAMAASIANAVDERDLGVAGAAQQMMTQVAVVTGIQILQTIQASRVEESGVVGSYSEAYLVGAASPLSGSSPHCSSGRPRTWYRHPFRDPHRSSR
jgi:hypothetical protein